MSQLFVFGKFYDRFDEQVIKEKVDCELIGKAIDIGLNSSFDEKDQFMEEVEEMGLSFEVEQLISGIVNANDFNKKNIESIKTDFEINKAFHLCMEECSFGVALSAKEAKLEWLKCENNDEKEDW